MNSMTIFGIVYLAVAFAIYAVALTAYRKRLKSHGEVQKRVKLAMDLYVGLVCPIGFLGTMIVGGYLF